MALTAALVFAVALGGIGLLLYVQTRRNLDDAIDRSLETRARSLATLASRPSQMPGSDDDFQLLTSRDRIVASSAPRATTPLLTNDELDEARHRPVRLWRGEDARLFAMPLAGGDEVVVVRASLHQREHALEGLARSFVLGGLAALALATGLGYWLTRHALAPVEEMRARADAISRLDPVQRLPLPIPHDEIRRLGETLNSMLERLGTAADHERRFIADASHELRTPLGRIRTELELARTETEIDSLRASIDSALEETENLCALADDLLTLASLQEHDAPRQRTSVDLTQVVTAAADAATSRRLRESPRLIEVDSDPGLTVDGDTTALQRAVGNLVDNALRHGSGPIHVTGRRRGNTVEIAVRDHGHGFDQEFLPVAFDRFSRSRHARRTRGSGLGLALVQAIAHHHGGTASAVNHPDGGAAVIIVLPTRRSED
jgi:signal transduction histidine kinase